MRVPCIQRAVQQVAAKPGAIDRLIKLVERYGAVVAQRKAALDPRSGKGPFEYLRHLCD